MLPSLTHQSRFPLSLQQIGHHLLSLLPPSKTEQSPFNPTPEVLLQAVDSFIDLYADEESSYDKEVFRNGRLLPRLEGAVQGVRAAVSSFVAFSFDVVQCGVEDRDIGGKESVADEGTSFDL